MASSIDHGNGEGDRWDWLVAEIARNQPGMRAFLRTLLPCAGDADDVLQEANLVLWQKRQEYDRSRPFGPWARRIAYLQSLAFMKTRSRRREGTFSEGMVEALAVAAEARAATLDVRLEALRECLGKLSAADRQVVADRYEAGRSVTAMAQAGRRSPDAMSMHLHRLRKKLAECVAGILRDQNGLSAEPTGI
jgi:RNA polymerase sigma-70 factor (ECF subfamily)